MKEKENKAIEILNQLLDIGQNDKFYDKGLINEERINRNKKFKELINELYSLGINPDPLWNKTKYFKNK